jgi:hypothetical protein
MVSLLLLLLISSGLTATTTRRSVTTSSTTVAATTLVPHTVQLTTSSAVAASAASATIIPTTTSISTILLTDTTLGNDVEILASDVDADGSLLSNIAMITLDYGGTPAQVAKIAGDGGVGIGYMVGNSAAQPFDNLASFTVTFTSAALYVLVEVALTSFSPNGAAEIDCFAVNGTLLLSLSMNAPVVNFVNASSLGYNAYRIT